jgi:uncharacterized protein YjdB
MKRKHLRGFLVLLFAVAAFAVAGFVPRAALAETSETDDTKAIKVVDGDSTYYCDTFSDIHIVSSDVKITVLKDLADPGYLYGEGLYENCTFTSNPKVDIDLGDHKIYMSDEAAAAGYSWTFSIYGNNVTATIHDGTIENDTVPNSGVFATSGNCVNCNVTFKSVTLTNPQEGSVGLYLPADGAYVLDSCTVEAQDEGVEIRAGSLSVVDTTIKGGNGSASSDANGSGTTSSGTALAIAQHATKKAISVTVSGDSVIEGNTASVYQSDPQGNGKLEDAPVSVVLEGGTYKGELSANLDTCTFEVTGGTFDTDPSAYLADNAVVNQNADGSYGIAELRSGLSNDSTKAVKVVDKDGTVSGYVDEIIELSNGVLQDGDTVVLQDDIHTADWLYITGEGGWGDFGGITVTFDLNGHTLGTSEDYNDYGFCIAGSNINATIKNGTIENTWGDENGEAGGFCTIGTCTGDNITFESVTLDCSKTNREGVESIGAAAYLPADGFYTFKNCTVTGSDEGIEIRAGKLLVENSTVTGGNGEASSESNGNGTTSHGAAIAVAQHTTKMPITVTVKDSTITATAAVYQSDPEENGKLDAAPVAINLESGIFTGAIVSDKETSTMAITGGTYDEMPDGYEVADGYTAYKTAGGTFTVEEGHAYGDPAFAWASDNKSATATYVCANCGDKRELTSTKVDVKTVAATPLKEGLTTYTATFDNGGKTVTTSKSATIAKTALTGSVSYSAHVQNKGNMAVAKDGAVAGTTGQALRAEAFSIKVDSNVSGGIKYRVHSQNTGWGAWASDGAWAGTTGKALRAEAIQVELTGNLADVYDVYYRVHVQGIGWMAWAKNGEAAGTTGMALRAEAIEVVLVEKGNDAPDSGSAKTAFQTNGVSVSAHVQNQGWKAAATSGVAGTTGKALRLEGLKMQLASQPYSGSIEYQVHVQNIGWQDKVSDGQLAGTTGKALRAEAVKVNLTGEMAEHFDVEYRVHVQNLGWTSWVRNGEAAGTTGKALRAEAIEVRLVAKR